MITSVLSSVPLCTSICGVGVTAPGRNLTNDINLTLQSKDYFDLGYRQAAVSARVQRSLPYVKSLLFSSVETNLSWLIPPSPQSVVQELMQFTLHQVVRQQQLSDDHRVVRLFFLFSLFPPRNQTNHLHPYPRLHSQPTSKSPYPKTVLHLPNPARPQVHAHSRHRPPRPQTSEYTA